MRSSTTPWILTALVAALVGCPGVDDDDDTTGGEEPEGCESFSLQNIDYDFLLDDPLDALGYGGSTDAAWWTELARQYADDPGEPDVLSLGIGGPVSAHEADGDRQRLDIELQLDEATFVYLRFWYFLPQGKTIPAAVGDVVNWVYVWNFIVPDQPATAPMILDETGATLLFYGEPGANGITFGNDPTYPDTANPIFEAVRTRDVGCSPSFYLDCGDQYNLETEFVTVQGETVALWPGETGTFELGDPGAEQAYEVTNVWSYDWRDVTCDGPQYQRNFAFFVLPVL